MQRGDAETSLIGRVTTATVRLEASDLDDRLLAQGHNPCPVAQRRLSRLYHAWEP